MMMPSTMILTLCINLTEKNIIAGSRPQPLYKAGAKAENSHIDVQNLKTVLSL